MTAEHAAPVPGDEGAALPENRKRAAADAAPAGQVKTSRTGAVMGVPDAEHGAYGMRREDAPAGQTATEPQIRGVEDDKPAPRR